MTSEEDARADRIIDVLTDAFSELMKADPDAFRRKFRKMAADAFAFYRGSACLFYADVGGREDPWVDERTSRVWIQGDLHAENFGTYMDGTGVLVFDVNDFDEAYLGHYTWDIQRLAASVALLGWTKALPDEDIATLIETFVRAYVDQIRCFAEHSGDHGWALRLDNARGSVKDALLTAQLATRVDLLSEISVVEDYQRRLRNTATVRRLENGERDQVMDAYRAYLETIPDSKRLGSISYEIKDIVGKTGFGIGSAGLPAFSLLVEGHTQALENDVVLTMKQGNVAAPSRVVKHEVAENYFAHHGHRTAVSQSALQAHADPWLGWTELAGTGFVVSEFSPYVADLDWSVLTEPPDMGVVLEQLGQATAKVHCVSDEDMDETPLVEFQTEDAILEVLDGRVDEFVGDMVSFGLEHATRVRADHALFVDAFRNARIPGIGPSG